MSQPNKKHGGKTAAGPALPPHKLGQRAVKDDSLTQAQYTVEKTACKPSSPHVDGDRIGAIPPKISSRRNRSSFKIKNFEDLTMEERKQLWWEMTGTHISGPVNTKVSDNFDEVQFELGNYGNSLGREWAAKAFGR